MVRLFLTAVLLILLVGCNNIGLLPTSELVQKAIATQLEQTQQQLNQQLDLNFQGFEIKHLKIRQEKPLTIQNLPAFQVLGTYDLTFQLPNRQLTKLQQPFDIYLQIQQEGKTWRLLLPDKASKDSEGVWRSYLIP
ncbi:hypothetical protein [Anabaena azotica]|uniref:Lipoprotein n=1 Tax=Anabaena azotica FACHB-119 TaxID=947527 RepID=A0ABR8D2H9_9NOST|nr:hypothetical protein [Anabaena azotica]MBD2500391.1 hypothetical protein [Anabaena azotica FACHB-119]